MSGVLYRGVQYEHCNNCGEMVPIGTLAYELPSVIYPYGRDICRRCAPLFTVVTAEEYRKWRASRRSRSRRVSGDGQ